MDEAWHGHLKNVANDHVINFGRERLMAEAFLYPLYERVWTGSKGVRCGKSRLWLQ
jgi:hypothetical protein